MYYKQRDFEGCRVSREAGVGKVWGHSWKGSGSKLKADKEVPPFKSQAHFIQSSLGQGRETAQS